MNKAINKKTIFTDKEKELLVKLWQKIQKKRKGLKLSQTQLSEATWIDRSYISMVERWETNISYLKLKKIEEVLKLKI